MKPRSFFKSVLVLLLVCCIFFALGAIFNHPASGTADNAYAQTARNEPDVDDIFNTIQLLREEYIKNVDPYMLLQGTVSGMKSYLKVKKLDSRAMEGFAVDKNRTFEANLRKFSSAYGKILMYNGGKINETDLVYAGLSGMMKAVAKNFDDPYSVALAPKDYEALEEQLNSKGFSGIGIFIELDKKHDNLPMVVEPVEGSPAQKAGLKAGDYIIAINGVPTKGLSLDAVSNRVRGPLKTPVSITIQRKKVGTFTVRMVRDLVQMHSVSSKMINRVGYIKLRFFGETTSNEMKEALTKLQQKGAQGIVLDLRNNGGGYIVAADEVCSFFVKEGVTVTSVVNYRNGTTDVHRATGTNFKKLPLAVIVNNFSASASEITAGCIKDNKAGILIGVKTFGKGSVQTIHQVSGGGAVKYTTAHYLTPSGKDINKMGITPDIVIKMDPVLIGTGKDTQLQKAVAYLSQKVSRN